MRTIVSYRQPQPLAPTSSDRAESKRRRPIHTRLLGRMALWCLLATVALPALGQDAREPASTRRGLDFDVRGVETASVRPSARQMAAADRLDRVTVRWNERYGGPAVAIRHGGYLSPAGTDPETFLRRQRGLLGLSQEELADLVVVRDYETRHNGARHLIFEQHDRGRTIYGSQLKLTLDGAGRVVLFGGSVFSGQSASDEPKLNVRRAVTLAAASLGVPTPTGLQGLQRQRGLSRYARFGDSRVEHGRRAVNGAAELVTFPMPPENAARLAWKVVLEIESGWYETVLDAASGELLRQSGYAAHAAPEGNVFTVQNPTLGSRQIVPFVGAPFNDAGWVAATTTTGNNVDAYQDLDNDDVADYRPQTPPLGDSGYQRFDYPFTDAFVASGGTDVQSDRDAAITQAFYRVNFLHDYFYALGFDEPAGNFQDDNFGRGGAGGDPMRVEVHNGFAVGSPESPNTQTPPDGMPPRMELNAQGVDHAFDADLVTHEFTHGVGNRLVAGQNLPFGVQTWALGEGWSDFFGTSIWNDPIAGEYVCNNPTTGCPLFAYDDTPLVYSDLCTLHPDGCEPHRDGEIWTAALWDLRRSMIAKLGHATGKQTTEQLVVDGMKNTTPTTATFLDARDGVLAADMTNSGGAFQCRIWAAFAGREMGLSAGSAIDQASVVPATDVPSGCLPLAEAGGPYDTVEGGTVSLSGAGSTPGTDPSAALIEGYDWDLDNDGQFDDASGVSVSFVGTGQDGSFTAGLRVTNGAGITATDTATINVANVAPSLQLDAVFATAEGSTMVLSGTATDPGWLESLSATVDWGDGSGVVGLPGSLENQRPDATLSFTRDHVYGDNGTFSIAVCVADDDTSTCGAAAATITNVDPVVSIDPDEQSTYDGVSAYIIEAGESVAVETRSTDPGSDDLAVTWQWGDGSHSTVSSLVNPPSPDPPQSPTLQPRDVDLTQSHQYGEACLYLVTVQVLDDDGGSGSDETAVVVVGEADQARGAGWWLNQYRTHQPNAFSAATLQCYLDVAVFLSTVFEPPLDRALAVELLFPKHNKGSATAIFDRYLLAAWLNFANGAFGLTDAFDSDGDGTADTTFGAAILAAEAVRNDPAALRATLLAQKDILERITGTV